MDERNTCKNCGNEFTGRFCNNCGEKLYTEKDRTVKHLLQEGLHFITHFDGTLLNTVKAIFTKPGQLSLDYCNGIRKRYFKPLSFFLLLVILYLLFPVFEGLNMKLYFHEHHNTYGKYATSVVERIISERHITQEQLAESFHHAGEKTSKFLLFIVVPMIALVSWLMGRKHRKLFFDHFVFSLEITSFFILWGFLLLPLLVAIFQWITSVYVLKKEWMGGIAIMMVFLVYLMFAAKRFFNFKWGQSILYAILYAATLLAILEYIYKFILFFIAIHLA